MASLITPRSFSCHEVEDRTGGRGSRARCTTHLPPDVMPRPSLCTSQNINNISPDITNSFFWSAFASEAVRRDVLPTNMAAASLLPVSWSHHQVSLSEADSELNRSSAPPLYLLLFLSATYILQRPCVYCSLLLAILILVLFDFNKNWFEPQLETTSADMLSSHNNSTSAIQDVLQDSMSMAATILNGTAGVIADAMASSFTKTTPEDSSTTWAWLGGEWLKAILARRELRIPCVNAVLRL